MHIIKNFYLKSALISCTIIASAQASMEQRARDPFTSAQKFSASFTFGGQNAGSNSQFLEFAPNTGDKKLDGAMAVLQGILYNPIQYLKNQPIKPTQEELDQAKLTFSQAGPSLKEILTPAMGQELVKYAAEQSGAQAGATIQSIIDCVHKQSSYDDEKTLGNMRAYAAFSDPGLLGFQKLYIDDCERRGKSYELPDLYNVKKDLEGSTYREAITAIFKAALSKDAVNLTINPKDQTALLKNLQQVQIKELPAELTSAPCFHLLYQAGVGINMMYAIRQAAMIKMLGGNVAEINRIKRALRETSLGNADKAAATILTAALTSKPDVFCFQETSKELCAKIEQSHQFLPLYKQPNGDCKICVKQDIYSDYEVIHLPEYSKYTTDHNALLLSLKRKQDHKNNPIELVATFHASSRFKEDRDEIMRVLDKKAEDIARDTGKRVVLFIQGDANTTNDRDAADFLNKCSSAGFKEACTTLGERFFSTVSDSLSKISKCLPTTSKMRLVTEQINKIFVHDKATKSYIFFKEYGAKPTELPLLQLVNYMLAHGKWDKKTILPNHNSPADHHAQTTVFKTNY